MKSGVLINLLGKKTKYTSYLDLITDMYSEFVKKTFLFLFLFIAVLYIMNPYSFCYEEINNYSYDLASSECKQVTSEELRDISNYYKQKLYIGLISILVIMFYDQSFRRGLRNLIKKLEDE